MEYMIVYILRISITSKKVYNQACYKGVCAMNIQEMKEKKKEKGYTNEQIAELSGVPLGTVQKIFGGTTTSPRYDTLKALEKFFA